MSPDRKFAISAEYVNAQTTGYSVIQSYNAFSYINTGAYLAPLRLVVPSYTGNHQNLYDPGTNGDIMDTEYVSAEIISALNDAPYSTASIVQPSTEPAIHTIQYNIVQRSLILDMYPLLAQSFDIAYPNYGPGSGFTAGYITDQPNWSSTFDGGMAYIIATDDYPTA